jgi:hypothetical protein
MGESQTGCAIGLTAQSKGEINGSHVARYQGNGDLDE